MEYIIYQGEKVEVTKNGLPFLEVKVHGFFTDTIEIYKDNKLIVKGTLKQFISKSINISYQDLPHLIEIVKIEGKHYLLYENNELRIDFPMFKTFKCYKNWEQSGVIDFPKKITFGYAYYRLVCNCESEEDCLYFLILFLLQVPEFRP